MYPEFSLWRHHPYRPSQSWDHGRALVFSPIKSYTKAWIFCKMLEKSKFLLPSNTRGKAESSKDFRKLSPVMGRKCTRPPACLVDRMKRLAITLGAGLFCTMDGCLIAPVSPPHTEVTVLWDWSLVSLIYFWTGSYYVALAYTELTDIGLPLPSKCLESYALPRPI